MTFDETYYRRIIAEYGYNPLHFQPINFDLYGIKSEEFEKKWLCHHEGNIFACGLNEGAKCIVTTGVGLSGPPHMGTVSQIMRAIFLQKIGLRVQFVLGDLDSYNARNKTISFIEERAAQYREFIIALGFDPNRGILRTQKERVDILLTAYLISNCLRDKDFKAAEEDLSELYQQEGVYLGIEFPVKQAVLLMTADFVHLGMKEGNEYVLVMLGLEEHLYVLLTKKVISRMNLAMRISALYSRIIKGLGGYPKMSKSIPGSAITVDMKPDSIRDLIVHHEGPYTSPLDSVVYQMMCSVSYYSREDLDELYEICQTDNLLWQRSKVQYAEMLIEICNKWRG